MTGILQQAVGLVLGSYPPAGVNRKASRSGGRVTVTHDGEEIPLTSEEEKKIIAKHDSLLLSESIGGRISSWNGGR